jgi:rhamnose utilization protein RhaD (predicted bifunctional aldolase and dehydrogenase)/NAD(P)-dependent dehydrogenase (short-subunit alcohol dehydrogenase family)
MKNLFDEREAQEFVARYPAIPAELALRTYTARLVGKDAGLVLHGGGNTSVKIKMKNILGEFLDVLFVKGSGADLSTIEPGGFASLELEPLRKLQRLLSLSEEEMENQLQVHKVSFSSPNPSLEALLHAFLPARYIDHSHPDSILTLTNLKQGEGLLREALGPKVSVLPYIRPGILLAKGALERYEKDPQIEAIVVIHHGIFTFADDAKTSYARMIHYVSQAERFIAEKIRGKGLRPLRRDLVPPQDLALAAARFSPAVRGACAFQPEIGQLRRFYVETRSAPDLVEASLLPEARDLCSSGVLTPDHVSRTKNLWVFMEGIPQDDPSLQQRVKQAVRDYQENYDRYFATQVAAKKIGRKELDPYPRVFLVAGVGIVTLGFTRKAAWIAADIAEHTLRAKLMAGALGEYVPISDSHIFDMEYWSLQQKKLDQTPPPPLQGQVALVTGAAGAIGYGIADRLLAAGAVVVISDIDPPRLQKVRSLLAKKYGESQVESIIFDVTDFKSVESAFMEISRRLGGLDIVVPNAGVAHVAKIEELDPQKFDQVIAVNFKGIFHVIKASIPVFKRQGTGGNIVVISTKNVFDPGAAFGAYSASKAGGHQIAKIAALELAELGVRVNLINPDAVFGDEEVSSKLWDLIGVERAKSRGLDLEGLKEFYRQRSLLKVWVRPEHVGNAVVFFASDQTPTTGATLPVDAGIPAAFPR